MGSGQYFSSFWNLSLTSVALKETWEVTGVSGEKSEKQKIKPLTSICFPRDLITIYQKLQITVKLYRSLM